MPNKQRTSVREFSNARASGARPFTRTFRSKEDVLHSTYEGIFGVHKGQLHQDTSARPRLLPVSEFLEHLAGARPVMVAFRKAGLADDMRSQFIGCAADIIECRIRDLNLSTTVQPRLAARMLAAAFIESLDWWLDHESTSAAEIENAFHLLAQTVIGGRGSLQAANRGTARQERRALEAHSLENYDVRTRSCFTARSSL